MYQWKRVIFSVIQFFRSPWCQKINTEASFMTLPMTISMCTGSNDTLHRLTLFYPMFLAVFCITRRGVWFQLLLDEGRRRQGLGTGVRNQNPKTVSILYTKQVIHHQVQKGEDTGGDNQEQQRSQSQEENERSLYPSDTKDKIWRGWHHTVCLRELCASKLQGDSFASNTSYIRHQTL